MRIGLIRHFPVEEPLPSGWMTAADLQRWRARYDHAATSVGPYELGGIAWQACIASDLPRTRITAGAVFGGPVEYTPLLREAEFAEFTTGSLRLPVWIWKQVMRVAWMTGHRSQRSARDEFRRRVSAAADLLCAAKEDLLVVSHAGMMAYLGAELLRRGFSGPRLRVARHAVAYVYERIAHGATMPPEE